MNQPPGSQRALTFVAVLGAFLVVIGLVYAMKHYTRPAPLDQARAAERKQALAELRAAEEQALKEHAWQDQAKGIVRLKVDRAMELTVQEYQSPGAARTTLLQRVEKAYPPPPPPVNYE